MADAVTSCVFRNDNDFYGIHLTNISDATGEADVIKVDRSALIGPENAVPTKLGIASCRWNIQGFTKVTLYWEDADGDVTAMVLAGSGYDDFESQGGGYLFTSAVNAAATDGDIKLSTTGTTSGNSYDITLLIRKIK
jgi:hypothetical protein